VIAESKSGISSLDLANAPTNAVIALAINPAGGLEQARLHMRRLALGHYENFSVISMVLPRRLRQDFCNVYAFCRVADDMGDEVGDKHRSLELLADLRQQTLDCYAGKTRSELFTALSSTIEKHHLPAQPFLDLIDAFEQDQRVIRYENYGQVLDYCRRSANPVGRLVLYLCGFGDPVRQALSDNICTALQLTNFWQDVKRDIVERNRIYLPLDSMRQFNVAEQQIVDGRGDDNYRRLIRYEVDRTAELFDQGAPLLNTLPGSVRMQVSLFLRGGRAILQAIRDADYDTLAVRPTISKWNKAALVLRAAADQARRTMRPGATEVSA